MIYNTELYHNIKGLRKIKSGKVRDIYDLDDSLLLVASDRISAFDFILGSTIPDKGIVLNNLTLFWLEKLKEIIPNHYLSSDLEKLIDISELDKKWLQNRSMIVKKANPLPIECIVRGYLIGSGWKEYEKTGTVCSIKLANGIKLAEKLPEPIFTPSTKADTGHDVNISLNEAENILGKDIFQQVQTTALKLYTTAANYALTRGVIIADTKFEFGLIDNQLILIDEVLTPDSSRFWSVNNYQAGKNPDSFDKQYVRDWLENASGWNKQEPAPTLPKEVIEKTRQKYLEAYELITDKKLFA